MLYCFGIQFDVTPQRAAEAALRGSHKLEAVGQLTNGMAPDFDTLPMVAAGNPEPMRRSDNTGRRERLPSRTREAVARAQRSTEARNAVRPGSSPAATPNSGAATIATGRTRLGPEAPEIAAGEAPATDHPPLAVADAGTGTSPEVLDRATEPFFTTEHNASGSGLALSTAYRSTRRSRGRPLLRPRALASSHPQERSGLRAERSASSWFTPIPPRAAAAARSACAAGGLIRTPAAGRAPGKAFRAVSKPLQRGESALRVRGAPAPDRLA